jgi:diguanylate cyclase
VARHGGEEFTIILSGASESQALRIIERTRLAIVAIKSEYGAVTASFGMAQWSPFVGSDEALILMTDDALYGAKRRGRNCIVVWEPKKRAA